MRWQGKADVAASLLYLKEDVREVCRFAIEDLDLWRSWRQNCRWCWLGTAKWSSTHLRKLRHVCHWWLFACQFVITDHGLFLLFLCWDFHQYGGWIQAAGEIWVASALVEEALADVVGDSDRLHAFKYACLDIEASCLPLGDAVENDLCICLFLRFLLHAAIPYFDNCFTGMSLSDPRWTKRRKFLTQAQYDSAK